MVSGSAHSEVKAESEVLQTARWALALALALIDDGLLGDILGSIQLQLRILHTVHVHFPLYIY